MKIPKKALAVPTLGFALLATSGYGSRESAVLEAAKRGDVGLLRAELGAGADVNVAQGDGFTALHWAAKRGQVEVAEILIAAGADLEAATRLGNHLPLHVAAAAGQPGVAAALLAAGAPVDAVTGTGAQPIHFAAASGNARTVAVLAGHGADPNARETEWGLTPLMFASVRGRTAAVEALVAAGADPSVTASVLDVVERARLDNEERRARQARLAEERGGAGILFAERPENRGAGAGGRDRAPAGGAGLPPDPLNPEADIRDANAPKPLTYEERVRTHGGLTALLFASREGRIESALALLAAGAEIDQRADGSGTTPLLMAAINGHFDLAMELLARGADPTLADSQGATPLYGTINTQWIPKARHPQPADYLQQETSHLELMESLIEAGAEVNARIDSSLWYTVFNVDQLGVDRSGATAFWRAAYSLDIPAMKLLRKHGADPHLPTIRVPERRRLPRLVPEGAPDPSGLPPAPFGGPAVYPIHAAAGVGYGLGLAANSHRHAPDAWLPAVKYLVEECGADATVRDHNGYTTIHHAASRGDTEMVRYLIDHGADPLAVARTGQTTIDLANGPVQRINPFPETIALLESHGARNNHACVGC